MIGLGSEIQSCPAAPYTLHEDEKTNRRTPLVLAIFAKRIVRVIYVVGGLRQQIAQRVITDTGEMGDRFDAVEIGG